MPEGCFAILLPKDTDYKILGYYFKSPNTKFEVSSDLFLRLNLDHSKNDFNWLKLKNLSLVSYHHKFTNKILQRKASGIYLGLLLSPEDEPDKFKNSLKEASETIENTMNFLEMSKNDFEAKLKELYMEKLETLTDILDPSALKNSLINRAKEMLSGGKKERAIAQELLQKIEEGIHTKIIDHYKAAQEALKVSDHEKAAKSFEKAAEIAEEIYEIELAKTLRDRSKLSGDIPLLVKQRDRIVQEARTALKAENFHSAYIFFKKASEISKDLMEMDKEEEYRLKSKALQDFYQIDEKFKKK